MNQPVSIESRRSSVLSALAPFGITPSFPPIDATNLAEGADGDCVCPYANLHTKPETDLTKPTCRIWLDRPDGNRPDLGGRIFLSCRHESCREALWEGVTLPARRSVARTPGAVGQRPLPPNPETQELNRKKLQAAIAGKARTEAILNDAESINTTEADIMDMSPVPVMSKKGTPLAPVFQASLHLSLFHPDDLVYWGEVESARESHAIRPRREWDKWLDSLLSSAVSAEDPHLWPWPGRFTTQSTYKATTGGRNLLNLAERRFIVCESDKLSKKDQLRVIRAMIRDPRLPIAYVLHSGGKSYHIGIKASAMSELEKAYLTGISGTLVPKEFYRTRKPERFGGMGFDNMTVREVQPVRIPGPLNARTGKPQRLLYIDPSMGYDVTPPADTTTSA